MNTFGELHRGMRSLWTARLPLFIIMSIMTILLLMTDTVYAQSPQQRVAIQQQREMSYPVVLLQINFRSGTGTVIYSGPCNKDKEEWCTYILTNDHFAEIAISVSKEKKIVEGKEIEMEVEKREPIGVRWFEEDSFAWRENSPASNSAVIVVRDEELDFVLLRLENHSSGPHYTVFFQSRDTFIDEYYTVWAVGAGLGVRPFPTKGIIGNLTVEQGGKKYIQTDAEIIYGNSGGGLFVWSWQHNRYEMIGVPTGIPSERRGGAVSHMGISIPIGRVRVFLKNKGFGFILEEQDRLSQQTRRNTQ